MNIFIYILVFSEMYKINKVLLTIIFKQKLMPVILGH